MRKADFARACILLTPIAIAVAALLVVTLHAPPRMPGMDRTLTASIQK